MAAARSEMFLTDWDSKTVARSGSFWRWLKKAGIISKVPAEDKYALFVGS